MWCGDEVESVKKFSFKFLSTEMLFINMWCGDEVESLKNYYVMNLNF